MLGCSSGAKLLNRIFWKLRTRKLTGEKLRVTNYDKRQPVSLRYRLATLSLEKVLGGREIDYVYQLLLDEKYDGPSGEYEFLVNHRPTYLAAKRYFEEHGIVDENSTVGHENIRKFISLFGESWEVTSINKISKHDKTPKVVEPDEVDGIAEVFCQLFFEMNSCPAGRTTEANLEEWFPDQLSFKIYGRDITPGIVFKAHDFSDL